MEKNWTQNLENIRPGIAKETAVHQASVKQVDSALTG